MALTNFTEDENQKIFIELFCSAEFIRGVYDKLIFLSALNIFLSITAFLGNTLILVALHKETSLHPPSKLLYRNLAITDLCVGIIVEPLTVTYWTSVVNERWDICYHANWAGRFSSRTLCSVSLLTLTAISVDRLLALLLGLRYRQVVTLRRTCLIVFGFWILSIVGSSTLFWSLRILAWYQYIYSYFEKGCRKKCTRQSRKVLWVVLSALFFKEIWKNGTGGHGHMFASTEGKQQKYVRQLLSSGTVCWSYPILPFGIVACTFFLTTFLEMAVYSSVSSHHNLRLHKNFLYSAS